MTNEIEGSGLQSEKSCSLPSINEAWSESMLADLVKRVEKWIHRRLIWDTWRRIDREQMALDVVFQADAYFRKRNLRPNVSDMLAMCGAITNRKIASAFKHSRYCKNSVVFPRFCNSLDLVESSCGNENHCDSGTEFDESFEQIWNMFDEGQKQVAQLLSQNEQITIQAIAMELGTSASGVCRIRDEALRIARKCLGIRQRNKKQETRNKQTTFDRQPDFRVRFRRCHGSLV